MGTSCQTQKDINHNGTGPYRKHVLILAPTENPFRVDIFVASGISHWIVEINVIDFGGIVAFFLQQC
tara:strand:- start:3682 stop:3882 length:201 start_codon:yes stop_codon:yes gene_type:complete